MVERQVRDLEVAGSNPVALTSGGFLAAFLVSIFKNQAEFASKFLTDSP